VLLFFVLREPKDTQAGEMIGATQSGGRWVEVLKTPNIVVCMAALLCAMACVFVLSALVPVYLTNALGLTLAQMSVVTSAIGFGGFFGQFGWPGLSDRFGRKPLAILGFVGATISVWVFSRLGADMAPLFAALFVTSFFCLGNIALITGPIATESAPVGLVSSAIGLVVGTGEIFGGGLAPVIADGVARAFGLPAVLYVALTGVVAGIFVCFFLRETAPARLGRGPGNQAVGPVA
jgi:predicted MFS family arabinose efflux permease